MEVTAVSMKQQVRTLSGWGFGADYEEPEMYGADKFYCRNTLFQINVERADDHLV